ncbi:MAG: hypothetical protein EAZ76_02505 [Nostocales cyanobacterium]|nr:MAG: hypothetical protein EAZ87_05195 [Nostocales cyanobacterium]TAF20006.1 MAG: hypothetical protein EAZ76_02505 [Nostocales cyanobacterium]
MKSYKILALGASGAGKTVFLASLYKELSTQGKYGFYVDVENQHQKKKLNQIYTKIITGETWPPGTIRSEFSEWKFTCKVKNEDLNDYPACDFTYYDYCGGRLTDTSYYDEEFDTLVRQADSLLGLLDGQKIYGILNETNNLLSQTFLTVDLPSIIKQMQKSTVPVHFIITKWDLLSQKFTLNQVIDYLMKCDDFQELITQRNQIESPVRLIPVSSIGAKFAQLKPDGSMKKFSGAIPQPYYTEVPIACVFPDGLKARINHIKKKQQELDKDKNKDNSFGIFFDIFNNIRPLFGIADEYLFPFLPPQYQLAKSLFYKLAPIITQIANKQYEEMQKRTEELNRKQQESLKQVKDEETALTHAVDSFLYIQSYLNTDYPESDLSNILV